MTRSGALKSLEDFLPRAAAYQQKRSRVEEGHGNVSRLSAAIRFRLILEDEIIAQTLAEAPMASVEKWLQEVCWRRYWKGWLEMRPDVWRQWRQRVSSLPGTLSAAQRARAEAVAAGESGVACMDEMARELVATGYLHNHARMWWASYWIHVERLPWELGADFFFRHLWDADPASNTLSWRWVAGLQTPGKTYLVRLSNIEKYGSRYLAGHESGCQRIADGVVEAAAVAECADTAKQPLPTYPTCCAGPGGRAGLWLHPDDLVPEVGPLAAGRFVSIAACLGEDRDQAAYDFSAKSAAARRAALRDGLARGEAHFGCGAVGLEGEDSVEALCDWAERHQLDELVGFAPMVGPMGDLVPRLETQLGARGIRLTLLRRESDAVAFSFAGAGFFPFWQKMSRHISQLESL